PVQGGISPWSLRPALRDAPHQGDRDDRGRGAVAQPEPECCGHGRADRPQVAPPAVAQLEILERPVSRTAAWRRLRAVLRVSPRARRFLWTAGAPRVVESALMPGRRRGVVLLGAWFLMAPPVPEGKGPRDPQAPLSSWTRVRSFDKIGRASCRDRWHTASCA